MKRLFLAALLALVGGSAMAAESTITITVGSGTTVLGALASSGAHSGAFSSRINIGDATNPAIGATVDTNGLHVAIVDGADVALGAQADAAYSGTGSGSLISISKGIFGALSGNLGVTITSPVDGSGNLLVSPVGITVADEAAFTAGTSTFSTVGGFFQTTATSNALTNGQSGQAQMTANRALMINLRTAAGAEIGTSAAPVGANTAQVNGVTTLAGAGATGTGSQRVTVAQDTTTVAGSASIPAGTNLMGKVGIDQTTPGTTNAVTATATLGTTNGWTPLLANALSTTVKAIKGSAGELGMAQCYNPNSSQIYVQVFNVASGSVTLGTTVPLLSIPIAATATGGFALSNPGINFSTAMSAAITTTATGLTAPSTAGDCNFAYN